MALVLRLRLRALEACQVGRRSARICRVVVAVTVAPTALQLAPIPATALVRGASYTVPEIAVPSVPGTGWPRSTSSQFFQSG